MARRRRLYILLLNEARALHVKAARWRYGPLGRYECLLEDVGS
jgi:hypothetical protein